MIHRVPLVMEEHPIIVSLALGEQFLMNHNASLNAQVISSTKIQSVRVVMSNVLHALERVTLSVCLVLMNFN